MGKGFPMNTTTLKNKCPECQRETTAMFHIDGQAMCGICKNIHFPPVPVTVQTGTPALQERIYETTRMLDKDHGITI